MQIFLPLLLQKLLLDNGAGTPAESRSGRSDRPTAKNDPLPLLLGRRAAAEH